MTCEGRPARDTARVYARYYGPSPTIRVDVVSHIGLLAVTSRNAQPTAEIGLGLSRCEHDDLAPEPLSRSGSDLESRFALGRRDYVLVQNRHTGRPQLAMNRREPIVPFHLVESGIVVEDCGAHDGFGAVEYDAFDIRSLQVQSACGTSGTRTDDCYVVRSLHVICLLPGLRFEVLSRPPTRA